MILTTEHSAWQRLSNIATMYRQSHLLYTALELGVFNCLSRDGAEVGDVAVSLGLKPLPARLLLEALAGIGLVLKKGSHFSIEPQFAQLLGKEDSSIADQLLEHKPQNLGWLAMADALREISPASAQSYEDKLFQSDRIAQYLRMVRESNSATGREFAEIFAVMLPQEANVLDVGGGHGDQAMVLLEKMPNATVTNLDLPKAINVCCKLQAEHPDRARLHLEVGDALEFNHQKIFDGIMTSDLLHSFTRPYKERILRNCFDALKNGGLMAVSKFRRSTAADDDFRSALFNLKLFINSGGGYIETEEELTDMLVAQGFEIEKITPIGTQKIALFARK